MLGHEASLQRPFIRILSLPRVASPAPEMTDPRLPPPDDPGAREPDWGELYRVARAAVPKSGISEDSADDIAQEALLAFATKRHTIRDPVRWVRCVVGRLVKRLFRRRYRRKRSQTVSLTHSPSHSLGEDELATTSDRPGLRLDVYRALARVPAALRKVLLWTERDGRSADEVAVELGLTRDEVYRRKRRAVRRFRWEMGQ